MNHITRFRREITSTVLWLLNYRLRIQCFKVTPYVVNAARYVNFEQIIPVKDIEDYIITMADKSQSDAASQENEQHRYRIRRAFWNQYISVANRRIEIYKNVSPSKDNWISGATGIAATGFNSVITKSHVRVEVYMSRGVAAENKLLFDVLFKQKDQIEDTFGDRLLWERLEEKKACRISYRHEGVNYFEEDNWPKMNDFMVDSMARMISVFKEPLSNARRALLEFLQQDDD